MADPANTTLGKMLMEHITPVVMVLPTPLVEQSCQKNGLTFVDLLSPFSAFDNIDVPVRTANDQPYRIKKFNLRLFHASDIRRPDLETAKAWMNKVVTEAGEKESYRNDDILPIPESESLPSWFEIFNQELIQVSSFSDHETFDHPVACLLVVSSNDEMPINKFVDFFNTDKLPSLLNDGAMDPKILKHYIILHDNQDGPPEKASKILSEMKNTFGSNECQLLCINSSQGGSVESPVNSWSSCKLNKEHFLNTDNIDQIKVLMQDLTTKHIIPHMEQKIRALNQQVSATRKGFRNQIKNLWWRKGKEDTPDTPDGPAYTFSSIESQIRVLGDYAFMLRDYDLALSNYRLISMDYKLDKSWKRYAGVQEMMALAYFMTDQARKEAEFCMESAFTTYLKLGLRGQQNAIRCGLWWAAMLKARDQFKEAANVYFRVSGEEPLQSAVMLEQASYCYLFSVPQMLRKYGFHLILSGDSYRKCDQMKHAIRTYKTALSVFRGTSWGLIRDHIHFQLGKWFAILGTFDVAIEHMLEILACTHQSKTAQELFLGDFLELVQKTGKTFEVCRLRLPVVKLPSLRVVFEDHRTYASPAAVGVRESIWKSLEEDMIPSSTTAKSNWLELHTKLVPKKCKQSNICVAGEAIKIDIGFTNPLQIPILISNVSLICKYFISSDEMESDNIGSSTNLQNDEQLRELIAGSDVNADKDPYTLSEVEFSLNGGETLLVQLTVTPKVEGMLKVVGVRWKLSGSVVGFQIFESDKVKKKNANKRKPKQSSGNELTFAVIKSLPRLEGSIRSLPKKSYLGELHRLVLELKNHSKVPVKNLKVRISHPRFLALGTREALSLEFPACLRMDNNEKCGHAVQSDETASLFEFPEDFIIQGEEPVLWPVWFRAAIPGMMSLYITVYYEMGDVSSIMRYRTLRMCHFFEVLPSLDVSFQVSRCPSSLKEFLVHMDLVNKTSSQSFEIHQLSCLGDQWDITMLQPVNIPSPIMAGQALSCFFKLRNDRKATVRGDEVISQCDNRGNHVRLGAQVDNEDLFDIATSPVADFHRHEVLHEEKAERYAETVDFILLSHPHNMSTESVDHSLLFSHHACLCSVASNGPLCWMMDGPRMIHHNFDTSFCEINLRISIHNSLDAAVSVRIHPNDSGPSTSQPSNSSGVSSENRVGWHDVSLAGEAKITSDTLQNTRHVQQMPGESVSPFIWCGSSSTRIKVAPLSTAEVPIQICVFAPGTYDISNYQLHWESMHPEGDIDADSKQSSGIFPGHSFYLTVLQSAT
ncbi:uncharacterized protein [Spinacia oleracea]|uniref:Uncharacterized protein isoform X2 n=1 Tax=Spinacia oleracea TaxID=3562 RepID=A0A9R0JSH0_SPIOL|nr:uncharacterized protein LOC110785340 isoform X2 [Spinacia oleracea]